MTLASYLRDRLPSACVRAASLALVALAHAAYGVVVGVYPMVSAGE